MGPHLVSRRTVTYRPLAKLGQTTASFSPHAPRLLPPAVRRCGRGGPRAGSRRAAANRSAAARSAAGRAAACRRILSKGRETPRPALSPDPVVRATGLWPGPQDRRRRRRRRLRCGFAAAGPGGCCRGAISTGAPRGGGCRPSVSRQSPQACNHRSRTPVSLP